MTRPPEDPSERERRREREDDLKATSDAIREDVARLIALEREKESLPPGDPEVDRLSDAAVDIADSVARKTRAERELTDELR